MNFFNKRPVILIFTAIKWEWSHTITQKLALEFSKQFNVIYINPRKELREIISNFFLINTWKAGLKKSSYTLLLVQGPAIFPKIYKLPWFDNAINKLYHYSIRFVAWLTGGNSKKIILVLEPGFSDYVTYYKGFKLVYYPYDCFDKYAYNANEDRLQDVISVSNQESLLVEKAEFFYTVSEKLSDYFFNKYNRKPQVVPNATSNIYFLDQVDKKFEKQALFVLKDIPGVKVGYSGGIKGVLQLEYIIEAAKRLPDYSFVFMGKIITTNIHKYDEKISTLFGLENVYYIGLQPVELLPYLLVQIDVLVMVYSASKDVWTYYGDPAKLFEYMATGKPIVSTSHPVVNKYSEYISIVQDEDDFIAALEKITGSVDKDSRQMRIELARRNTWAARISVIKQDLDD